MEVVIPSPEDSRDHQRGWWERTVSSVSLPDKVELDVWEVDNQLNHGSCLANAVTSALEIYLKRRGKGQSLSRMYVYWWIRALSKLHGSDSGGYPRNMVKAVNKFGVCPESMYPYTSGNLYQMPSMDATVEAIANADWEYERIPLSYANANVSYFTNVNTQIKSYLAQGIPVLLTLSLDDEFWTDNVGPWRQQSWRVKAKSGPVNDRGLHEVLIVGYDDSPGVKRFKVLNSWGADWGDQGYFGLMYRPDTGRVWQSTCIKELWVIKPK